MFGDVLQNMFFKKHVWNWCFKIVNNFLLCKSFANNFHSCKFIQYKKHPCEPVILRSWKWINSYVWNIWFYLFEKHEEVSRASNQPTKSLIDKIFTIYVTVNYKWYKMKKIGTNELHIILSTNVSIICDPFITQLHYTFLKNKQKQGKKKIWIKRLPIVEQWKLNLNNYSHRFLFLQQKSKTQQRSKLI